MVNEENNMPAIQIFDVKQNKLKPREVVLLTAFMKMASSDVYVVIPISFAVPLNLIPGRAGPAFSNRFHN